MTYLDWINAFWRIDEAVHFSGNQTRLYFCLLDLFNRARWPGEITCGDRLLAARAGISLNAFKRARDTLSRHGLIRHHPGGHGHADKARYQLLTPNRTPMQTPTLFMNKTKDFDNGKPEYKSVEKRSRGFVVASGDFD